MARSGGEESGGNASRHARWWKALRVYGAREGLLARLPRPAVSKRLLLPGLLLTKDYRGGLPGLLGLGR